MRTVLRWIARVLVGLLALVVVLLVVLSVLTRTEGGRDFVREQAESILDDVLVGEARIGEIEEISLLPTHLRVRDVVVTDARGREAIAAKLADVKLSPLQLLSGRVQVDSVYVSRPRLIVVTEDDGSLNLANLVPTSTPTPDDPDAEPWTIAVASASVARGWVEYRTPTSSRAIDRIELGGNVVFRDLATMVGAIDLDVRGPLTEAGKETPFRLTVKGEADRRAIDGAVRLRGLGSTLDAQVRGRTSSASMVLDEARVVINSRDIEPLALGLVPIGGALTATVTARGPIDNLDATAEVRARDYHFANVFGSALHVKATLRDLPERAAGEVTVNASKLKLDSVPLGDLQVEALATEAGKKFEGHVSLKGGRWVQDLDTQLRATREDGDLWIFVPTLVAETRTARWRMDDARMRLTKEGDIEVHRVVLQSKRGMISLDAELDEDLLDGPGFVKAKIEGLHLASIRRDFAPGMPKISGLLEADVDLRLGPAPKADVRVALDELTYPTLAGTIRARAEVQLDKSVVTASVAVTGPDLGRVRLDAQLDAPDKALDPAAWGAFDGKRVRSLSARVERLLLGRLEPLVPGIGFLAGVVDVTLTGAKDLATIDLEVRARDVRHRELPGPLTLTASTQIDGDKTQLTAALGIADQPLAAVMGRIDAGVRAWLRNPTKVIETEDAELEVALDGFPIALMEDFKPEPPGVTVGRRKPVLSGEITLHADVARKASKYKAELTASGYQLAWVEKMPKITATASVSLDETRIDLSGQVHGPLLGVLTVSGKGKAPRDPTDGKAWQKLGARALEALSLETKQLDLGVLDQMSDRRLALKGVVTSKIVASEGLGEVDASIKVVRFGRRHSRVLSDVQVGVVSERKRTQLDLGVYDRGRLVLSATASAPLDVAQLLGPKVDFQELPLMARVKLDKLPLGNLAEALELGVPMSGSVTGTVGIDGTLADYRGKAFIDASQAVVKGQSFQKFIVNASIDPRRLTAKINAKEKKGTGTLVLDTAVDLAGGGVLDATLQAARFRLDFLSAFFQRQRSIGGIAGVLDADVRFQGTPDKPSGKGKLKITDLAIVLASPIPPLDKTTVDATFDGQKVVVNVDAHSGDGDLTAKLDATLRTLTTPKFEMRIETDDLPFVAGPRQALIDAVVKVTGAVDETMSIDVAVESAKVEIPNASGTALKPIRDLADVVYVDEQRRDAVMGTVTSTAVATPVVVNINSKKPIPVRGSEIAALARIGLKIDGTSGVMEMAGRVMVGEGWLTLFGKRWDIQQAEIIMLGREEPRVQVEITRDLGSAVAIVRVRGSVSKPELQLLSDPPIFDEAQVLTFVLGAEPGSGDEDASLEGRAAGAAVGALVGALQSKLEDKLPIDTINVDVEEGAKISRLSVGKWITGRIFVGYEYAFDAEATENTNEGIVQVRLGSGWVLESRYGDRGEGGLDFIWVRRF